MDLLNRVLGSHKTGCHRVFHHFISGFIVFLDFTSSKFHTRLLFHLQRLSCGLHFCEKFLSLIVFHKFVDALKYLFHFRIIEDCLAQLFNFCFVICVIRGGFPYNHSHMTILDRFTHIVNTPQIVYNRSNAISCIKAKNRIFLG